MPRERQEGNERLRSLLAGGEQAMDVLTPRFLWKLPLVSPSPPAGASLVRLAGVQGNDLQALEPLPMPDRALLIGVPEVPAFLSHLQFWFF